MLSALNSFKRFCTFAGDIFAVTIIAILLLIPAVVCGALASQLVASIVGTSSIPACIGIVVSAAAYMAMVLTWLFKAYGSHPLFISFCMRHPRCREMTERAVDTGSAIWRKASHGIEVIAGALERGFAWAAGAISAVILILIIGAILYALFGALSAPWWAIVIIYLLLTKR
jgi:hypothetical protein